MALILSGTDGLSDVDGSASTPAIRGTDTNTGIFFPSADTIAFSEGGVEQMRLNSAGDLQMNSGYGSVATAFGCRAWVNFVGTGTPTIQASGNVSSIGDLGAGHYTVNFSTALPDTLFTAFNSADIGGWTAGRNQIAAFSTSGYECRFWNSSGTSTDPSLVVTAVIR
jgi:hypothetical protein